MYSEAEFSEYLLTSDQAQIEIQISDAVSSDPKLFLTVGSFATKIVSDRVKDRPIILTSRR